MTLNSPFAIFQNVLNLESKPEEVRQPTPAEIRKFTTDFVRVSKKLFDSKFHLAEIERNGTKMQFNEVLTRDGNFNLMYLPQDNSRKDSDEQVKMDDRSEMVAISVNANSQNPTVTFQIFEQDDAMPERLVANETNTYESIYRAKKLLRKLALMDNFELLYPLKPH